MSLFASHRRDGDPDRGEAAVEALEEEWRHGEPELERIWARYDPGATLPVLAALIKADLRCRFARGRKPAVNDYLERFPALGGESERMLSLIYEEFCLREEQGDQPDAESFCDRYAPWRDSLASQLKYHHLLSRVIGPSGAPPRFPEPGERFQEFTIISVLGRGGAGRVYRARNDLLGGREVALKVSPDRGQEPAIMGRLDHEHIVPVHSVVFQHETRLRGLIMPYRPGLPLDDVIRQVKPSTRPATARVLWEVVAASAPTDTSALSVRNGWNEFPMGGTYAQGVAWIVAALARGVAYAHSREIFHRDIKPANVLLTLFGGPQLLDFNLAHDPHAADQAEAALRGGTLPYMAPEQLEAFIDPQRWESVGASADLYSLGLVMHELLTGQALDVPDQSLPLPRAIRSMLDRRADQKCAPRRLNPAIPYALEAILSRCLAYRSADRYPSAQALADDLQRFLKHEPLQHTLNPSTPERLDNWFLRNWLRLVAVILVGGIAASVVVPRFTPVERQEAFLEALSAFDEGKPENAIRLLGPLIERFPDSPLLRIHMAAAEGAAKDSDKAAQLYSTTLAMISTQPHDYTDNTFPRDFNAPLIEICERSPATVRRFEELGFVLSEARSWVLARLALKSALRLGSTNEEVLRHLAFVNQTLGDLDGARAILNASILKISNVLPVSKDKLAERYLFRARVVISLGDRRSTSRSPGTLEAARTLYKAALDDLDSSRELLGQFDKLRIRANGTVRAEVEIALGDLDARSLDLKSAKGHLDRAEAIIHDSDQGKRDSNVQLRLEQKLNRLREKIPTLSP